MDFSEEALEGGAVAGWFGDVPDYYYRVGIEEWQLPFFCLRGLRVRDLDRFLVDREAAETLAQARTRSS